MSRRDSAKIIIFTKICPCIDEGHVDILPITHKSDRDNISHLQSLIQTYISRGMAFKMFTNSDLMIGVVRNMVLTGEISHDDVVVICGDNEFWFNDSGYWDAPSRDNWEKLDSSLGHTWDCFHDLMKMVCSYEENRPNNPPEGKNVQVFIDCELYNLPHTIDTVISPSLTHDKNKERMRDYIEKETKENGVARILAMSGSVVDIIRFMIATGELNHKDVYFRYKGMTFQVNEKAEFNESHLDEDGTDIVQKATDFLYSADLDLHTRNCLIASEMEMKKRKQEKGASQNVTTREPGQ